MFSSFARILKFSMQDIFRNMSLSLMTVLILVLMLLSINTLLVVRVLTNQSIDAVKEQIDVSIFFDPDSTDEQIAEVRDYISSFPEVEHETFMDREEVLADFKEAYADNTDIMASLNELGENPLGPTLIVKTREPEDYQKIINALSVPEYEHIIEAKTFGDTQAAIERIHSITTQVEKITYFLTALFAIISFVIIFNTIRVAIFMQRKEIGIKRLVGATSWFIRGPYLVESFIFTVVSLFITLGLVHVALGLFDPYVAVIFGEKNILIGYLYNNFWFIVGVEFLAVLFLTILSSGFAMGRYLRK